MNFQEIFALYERKTLFSLNEEYVAEKEHFLKNYSKNTDKINLKAFYDILSLVGDNHTFIIPNDLKGKFEAKEAKFNHKISLYKNVFMIEIPDVFFVKKELYENYIQEQIKEHIKNIEKYKNRLIIDLRNNKGGNLWAMIASLSFLFANNKILGYFLNKNDETKWLIKNNSIYEKDIKHFSFKTKMQISPKIAVLIGENTMSSGEALAI